MALSLIPLNPELYPPGKFSIPGEAQIFRVGREGGNDLQVNDSSVSAKHARIEISDGEVVDVVDCGSSNGTFVNGIRVERKQLAAGDLLRFAGAEFRVTDDPDAHRNGSIPWNGVTQAINLSRVGNHQAHENSFEKERDHLRGEVERLSAEVFELHGYLKDWQDCVSSRDEEIVRLHGNLSISEAALAELRVDHESEIAESARVIQEREESLNALSAASEAQINLLTDRLAERDAALEALTERSGKEVQTLNGRLKEAEDTFKNFSRDREADIKGLKSRLEEAEDTFKTFSRDREADIKGLKSRLKEAEDTFRNFSRDREADIKGLKGTIAERDGALIALNAKRDTEVRLLSEKLAAQEEVSRQLKREVEDCLQREQRNLTQISEIRKELMEREARIAALHYEVTTRDGNIQQLTGGRLQLQQSNDLALAEIEGLKAALETESQNVIEARESQNLAEATAAAILDRLSRLGDRLYADWSRWFQEGAGGPDHGDANATFARVEDLAGRIRSELDLIEPVWQQFGDHVQEELASRCGAFREDEAELSREIIERQSELASLKTDLEQFRELIDSEVRRAQGLSRRGTEIEIPERFEAMVIAKDREQEIFRALIERLEAFDRLLEGYRRSRKLREVTKELTEFRLRLAAILDAGGVENFQVEVGTFLSLKHRREVQILSRKGWGTSQFSEFPFQPGEVVKVVRPGYRVGGGEYAVILRKVEVLIRGVEG